MENKLSSPSGTALPPHLHPSPVCPPTLDTLASLSVPHPSPTLAMCTKYSLQHAICYKQNSVLSKKVQSLISYSLNLLALNDTGVFPKNISSPQIFDKHWMIFFPSFVLRTLEVKMSFLSSSFMDPTSIFPMIIKMQLTHC